MGFSLCLWKILSCINIPALLSSVGSCTLFLHLRGPICHGRFPLQDRRNSPAASKKQRRQGRDQARPIQIWPSLCCGSVPGGSSVPMVKETETGEGRAQPAENEGSGLAVPEPAQHRAPRAERGLAAEGAERKKTQQREFKPAKRGRV